MGRYPLYLSTYEDKHLLYINALPLHLPVQLGILYRYVLRGYFPEFLLRILFVRQFCREIPTQFDTRITPLTPALEDLWILECEGRF